MHYALEKKDGSLATGVIRSKKKAESLLKKKEYEGCKLNMYPESEADRKEIEKLQKQKTK